MELVNLQYFNFLFNIYVIQFIYNKDFLASLLLMPFSFRSNLNMKYKKKHINDLYEIIIWMNENNEKFNEHWNLN